MPSWAVDYIYSKEVTTQTSTLISYSYDLITFFKFIQDKNPIYKNVELKNIPLCHRYVNMTNEKKILDKYIIFGSVFQFNLIDKCTQFYVDGTFKSCPQTYYQNINFAGYLPDIKSIYIF